jgi:hypothetical protein
MAFEIARCYRPQSDILYSGVNNDQVCFEFHMDGMEWSLDSIPGITDSIKLKELEYWFSGMAGRVASRHLAYGENDTERLADKKDRLRTIFSSKSISKSLEKLM